jgi:hypothetical protein
MVKTVAGISASNLIYCETGGPAGRLFCEN